MFPFNGRTRMFATCFKLATVMKKKLKVKKTKSLTLSVLKVTGKYQWIYTNSTRTHTYITNKQRKKWNVYTNGAIRRNYKLAGLSFNTMCVWRKPNHFPLRFISFVKSVLSLFFSFFAPSLPLSLIFFFFLNKVELFAVFVVLVEEFFRRFFENTSSLLAKIYGTRMF